MVDKIKLLN